MQDPLRTKKTGIQKVEITYAKKAMEVGEVAPCKRGPAGRRSMTSKKGRLSRRGAKLAL